MLLELGTKQTLQKKNLGILPWEIQKKLWDLSVLFFGALQYFSQLCQFSSDFDVTILESGDKTNNIGDEFKTIRLILINTFENYRN